MSLYKATVDPAVRNSSHSIILDLVGAGSDVLDVGCASGYLGEALIANGSAVSGVEIDPEDAEKARAVLKAVVVADINIRPLNELFEPGSFDRVIFGDVLEHLADPAAVVRSAMLLLRPGGGIIISVPNVAHGALRLSLLQGKWDYRDTGLLDRTHVHFFTLDSLLAMVHGAGLAVTELRSTVFDPLGTEIAIEDEALPGPIVDWVRHQPTALDYQFVLLARPAGEVETEEAAVPVPAELVKPAADAHTERAAQAALIETSLGDPDSALAQVVDLRRRLLTSRDRTVGLEAEIGIQRAELSLCREELRKAHADATYAHAQLTLAIADVQQTHERLRLALEEAKQVAMHPLNRLARAPRSVARRILGR